MFHDPIVEEVRAIRAQFAGQFNFDIRKIVKDAQPNESANAVSGVVSSQQAGPATER